jgi:ADP-ribosylglycohydrolase
VSSAGTSSLPPELSFGDRQIVKTFTSVERSVACLKGLATGDAIGKQTETLKRSAVRQWYPGGVKGFHGELGAVIPRYIAKRYEWRIAETTDDTEQTLAVARTLIAERAASHTRIGRALMQCRKSNHPGVSLGRFQQRGDPDFICHEGDGCGAAMRVAPVGIVYSWRKISHLVEAAFQASVSTHGGQFGICAAAAYASAVSAAIDNVSCDKVLNAAIYAAREAEQLRPASPVGNMSAALQHMYAELVPWRQELPARLQEEDCFPDRPIVIVPLAISLALVTKSARETILLAANIGGDADSVASIGGALAAAMFPQTVDEGWYQAVENVNHHNLVDAATQLAALRN